MTQQMDRQQLKLEKEKFVSNLSGGSISEISAVTAIGLVLLLYVTSNSQSTYALWAALQTRTRAVDVSKYGLLAYHLDLAINSCCLLFSITTYSSQSILLNLLLLAPTVYLYFQHPYVARKPVGKEANQQIDKSSDLNPYLTAYRGGMMVITCLAILAVDFKLFPRRFAKCETWGTSLMDLGVGSFVFSSGVVSSRQRQQSPLKQIVGAFRSSAAILLLGITRTLLTKQVNYQEHVAEYGMHWNFFITLGLLPPFVTFLRLIKWRKLPYSVFACVIIVGYQYALTHLPIREYKDILTFIVSSERTDLLSKNREGLFSFIGYLSIFLVGMDIGSLVLPASQATRKRILVWLLVYSIVSITTFLICSTAFNLQVSRRLANFQYVLWTIAHNIVFLLGYLVINIVFFPDPKTPYMDAVPWTLNAINRNGLTIFLLVFSVWNEADVGQYPDRPSESDH